MSGSHKALLTGAVLLLACCGGDPGDDANSGAGLAPTAADLAAFNGRFGGAHQGQAVHLTLSVLSAGECRGRLETPEGTATILGRLSDGILRGTLASATTSSSFVARPQSDGLQFSVLRDGRVAQYVLARDVLPALTAEPGGPAPPSDAPDVQRDPRLIGRWTVSIVSGRINRVTTYVNAWLTADGKYQWGGSQSLITLRPDVGTPSTAGVENPNADTGEWMTADEVLYYRYQGDTDWRVWGRYGVGGDAVVVYPANGGAKHLWERP